jgi:light-regulated signal transduction histidine kinase (bacteriophytochrome)
MTSNAQTRELQQFAHVAAHDLQSPLSNIEGFVRLLKRKYQGKLDDKADELIGYVLASAGSMRSLISDLLEFSRVEASEEPFESVDMKTCVENALLNLKTTIEEKRAEIRIKEPLVSVEGDATQLTRLFQNLIGNALKFSQERPFIMITSERKDDAYVFSVAGQWDRYPSRVQWRTLFGCFPKGAWQRESTPEPGWVLG